MTPAARLASHAALVTVLASAALVHADEPIVRPTGFEADREASPPGRAEFSFDAGGSLGPREPGAAQAGRWALGVQLGYLGHPLRLHTSRIEVFPVRHRQTLVLGGALAVGPAIVVDARMPLSHQTGDRVQGLGDDSPLDNWVAGDLGLGARLRLTEREHHAAFVRGQLTLGTGNDFELAGEVNFTAAWMLIARAMPTDSIVVAATAGVRFRGVEVVVADRLLGDELFGAVGASYRLPAIRGLYCDANDVRVTAELAGALGNDVGNKRGPSPLEGKLGVVSRIRPWWAVAARVGAGQNDQIGAPRLRAMLELVYVGGTR
jgi:hypothetical protein